MKKFVFNPEEVVVEETGRFAYKVTMTVGDNVYVFRDCLATRGKQKEKKERKPGRKGLVG